MTRTSTYLLQMSKPSKKQMKQRTEVAMVDRSIMSLLPKRRQGGMTQRESGALKVVAGK